MAQEPDNCLVQKYLGYTELTDTEIDLLNDLPVKERPMDKCDVAHADGAASTHPSDQDRLVRQHQRCSPTAVTSSVARCTTST